MPLASRGLPARRCFRNMPATLAGFLLGRSSWARDRRCSAPDIRRSAAALGTCVAFGVGQPTLTRIAGAGAGGYAGGMLLGPPGIPLGGFGGAVASDWAFDPRTSEVAYWGSTVAYEVYDAFLAALELFWLDGPGS